MDYKGNTLFSIATLALVFAIFAASPMCVLPAKDSLEGFLGHSLSASQNLKATASLISACFLLAVFLPAIKDAITITGNTINPFVCFHLPCVFYLKLTPGVGKWEKACVYATLGFTTLAAVIGNVLYVYDKFT